ncbi:MAG: PilW family protein [Granulosicoccus sp.]|nr:PilW family protein [Granulosicoccus sp.]
MTCSKQSGFTLVELMVAMVIGLVLIAGMATVFSGIRRSAELNTALGDMQENARYILDTLARDGRMAGYQGCVNVEDTSATILANDAPTNNFFQSALSGSRIVSATNWTPAPPLTFTIPNTVTPVVGSDVLSIQYGNPETYPVAPMAQVNANIVTTTPNRTIQANDLVIVSNCQVADLIRVNAVNINTLSHTSATNSSSNVSARYGQGGAKNLSQVMKFESNVYFLADTGRTNESNDPVISLYRQSLPFSGAPQEIVESVDAFRVKYGIRQPGSNNLEWVDVNDVGGDFGRVQSLQIGLLVSSYERILSEDDNQTYMIAGDLVQPAGTNGAVLTHPGGRRMRLAFNTTINVRNR